jgi:hypothetical protein
VIRWLDFAFDEVLGATLVVEDHGTQFGRRTRLGHPSIRKDAHGESIQETGQEQMPARMAGFTSLESDPSSMDAGREDRAQTLRQREGT